MAVSEFTVSFAGGAKVNALIKGFDIRTDQSKEDGGEGSAPEPYLLFLASVGTCAGIYVARFCQKRDIPTDNVLLRTHIDRDKDDNVIGMRIDVEVPESFPVKYHKALARAASQCAVKKTIERQPEFAVRTVVSG